ncbi:MAG: RNA polymerase sigma factor [Verrucomicrobiales bacterium]
MESPQELIQAGYRYALSLAHHHHDAEDYVQQAWMKCVDKYGRVKNRSMLYTTIRRLFYDQCRRSKIVVFENSQPDLEVVDESGPEELSSDLTDLLATLRAEEREALYLHVVEGYSAREIAKLSGAPRNTILSYIHRAKAKLAKASDEKPSAQPRSSYEAS